MLLRKPLSDCYARFRARLAQDFCPGETFFRSETGRVLLRYRSDSLRMFLGQVVLLRTILDEIVQLNSLSVLRHQQAQLRSRMAGSGQLASLACVPRHCQNSGLMRWNGSSRKPM